MKRIVMMVVLLTNSSIAYGQSAVQLECQQAILKNNFDVKRLMSNLNWTGNFYNTLSTRATVLYKKGQNLQGGTAYNFFIASATYAQAEVALNNANDALALEWTNYLKIAVLTDQYYAIGDYVDCNNEARLGRQSIAYMNSYLNDMYAAEVTMTAAINRMSALVQTPP